MPLVHSKSKKAFDTNISEMIRSFKKKGRIGNTTPESLAKARKIALAAAFSIKRKEYGK